MLWGNNVKTKQNTTLLILRHQGNSNLETSVRGECKFLFLKIKIYKIHILVFKKSSATHPFYWVISKPIICPLEHDAGAWVFLILLLITIRQWKALRVYGIQMEEGRKKARLHGFQCLSAFLKQQQLVPGNPCS